ncbi:MmgE/PrpD family protein [Roseomonas sp. OT10]|uniref:MmgE/PrpD family protein n=1 Tax=Roseomonas cutis TaxID=2897332 RepID=UPI001E436DE9|nr:MmgE/PrpD family protein [Roseomonas sp. OT10]UFN48034.1 MmgE/PrpD family protein [Roseomonas sp. OT10]
MASDGGAPGTRALLGRAIADTLACAAAGAAEPAARTMVDAYAAFSGTRAWSGDRLLGEEAAAMADAVAGHALDFDDVFLESATHASVVILPAILRLDRQDDPDETLAAFAAGLATALAVARRLGAGHYHRGWHGTSTIGIFAATAAAGRLLRLDARRLACAFAMAAAQSGGLRLNFGTMAKPAQVGFAAAAGLRAARLAAAGVTGSADIFGPGGFAELYGAEDAAIMPSADSFLPRPDLMSLKLYPCCYAAHRLIGVTLDARAALGSALTDAARLRVTAPFRSLEVLRYDHPTSGMEAKFSGRYCIAAAWRDGPPGVAHFGATPREAVLERIDHVELREDPALDSGGDITFGHVVLEVLDEAGGVLGRFERTAIPGSPLDPPSREQVAAKLADCFDGFEARFGRLFPMLDRLEAIPEAAFWLAVPAPSRAEPAIG